MPDTINLTITEQVEQIDIEIAEVTPIYVNFANVARPDSSVIENREAADDAAEAAALSATAAATSATAAAASATSAATSETNAAASASSASTSATSASGSATTATAQASAAATSETNAATSATSAATSATNASNSATAAATSATNASNSATAAAGSATSAATSASNAASAAETVFASKTTTDLPEGTNLYYTTARFDTRLAAKSTTDLAEGTNLYYTQTRFDTAFTAKSTTNLSEGTNLYHTTSRARTAAVVNSTAGSETDQAASVASMKTYVAANAGNPPAAVLSDVKSSGTSGGSATSGSFQTRVLNTEVDPSGIVTLASNQFTLGSGKYIVTATAVCKDVNGNKIKIRNVTDSTDPIEGLPSSGHAANGEYGQAHCAGVIEIASSKTFELQHRVFTTRATDGFGPALSWGNEVYSYVTIVKIAG